MSISQLIIEGAILGLAFIGGKVMATNVAALVRYLRGERPHDHDWIRVKPTDPVGIHYPEHMWNMACLSCGEVILCLDDRIAEARANEERGTRAQRLVEAKQAARRNPGSPGTLTLVENTEGEGSLSEVSYLAQPADQKAVTYRPPGSGTGARPPKEAKDA